MKKRIAFCAVLVMCSSSLFAQLKPKQTQFERALKFNLLSPFVGAIALQYEKAINNDASYLFTASYFTGQVDQQVEPVRGVSACAEYRLYTGVKTMEGIYLQPFVRYQYYKDIKTNVDQVSAIGTGVMFGFQKIVVKNIIIDGYWGPAYNFAKQELKSGKYTTNDPGLFLNGYWMRGGFTVGFLF